MTVARLAPTTARLAAAALAAALLVAACGGSGPTVAPATQPAPTDTAAPSIELPTFDLGTFAPPSFAIPSFERDPELEGLLPDTIGGQVVLKQSMSGEAFLSFGMGGAAALEPMLDKLGATIDDLSVAFGTAGTLVVIAYQIDGVEADRIFDGLEAALQAGGGGGQISKETVGGRPVTKVAAAGETTYIYLAGDVVFIVGGQVTPELLEDAVSQLPAA